MQSCRYPKLISLVLSLSVAAVVLADEGAPEWPPPPVELLIVGSFHFSDAGLDSYRPKFDVDVLSPERQREIAGIVERLAAFAPGKVAVERRFGEQIELDAHYRRYRAGELEPSSDEIVQLGYRLAEKLGHERVWAVDAERRFYEPWVDPDEWAVANGQEDRLDEALWERYEAHHRFMDELKTRLPLDEYLLRINSSEALLLNHGQYVIGNVEVGDAESYPGVDSKIAWYNRNLRIFANLQRIADMSGDRLVLIIGSGHVPIIRHAAEASPQFRLVELAEVLRPKLNAEPGAGSSP